MQYEWVEDYPDPPSGVMRLGISEPESGKEYVMYHGTTWWAAQLIHQFGFQQSADGMLGRGIYLSRDLEKASRYPIGCPESDRVVIRVRVKVGNVIAINHQGRSFQKTWGLMYKRNTYSMQWAENNFQLPFGVIRLGISEPESDKEYVMYHGTTRQAAKSIQTSGFRQSEDGMLGRGVYLSRDLEKARRYPIDHPESDKVVIKVVVKVGKVIVINRQDHPLQKSWHSQGYDTAWVPPRCGMVESGLEENCVWDPERIRVIGTIQPRLVQPQPVQPQPVQPQPVQPGLVYPWPVPGFFGGGVYGYKWAL